MNLEYFIAKRLIVSKSYKSSVSSPIIKIAIWAIALSIFMMIISVATGIGLQQKIREKIAAFNGHVIVSNFDDNQSQVTAEPIDAKLLPISQLKKNSFITHVQPVITKGALIRTETDVEGIVFKGVDVMINKICHEDGSGNSFLVYGTTGSNNENVAFYYNIKTVRHCRIFTTCS